VEDNQNTLNHIAIVGMSCRFPGADSVEAFWHNIVNGQCAAASISDDELRSAGVPEHFINDDDFVKMAYAVSDIEHFDAAFFQYTPREADITDPQQRLLLECSYEALEHAGYTAQGYSGLIGVYAGIGSMAYYIRNLIPHQELLDSVGTLRMSIGNEKSFAATMVSFKLNLTGPSVNVDTACSTSLVAVHQACQSLLSYECDMALTGGVSLDVPQKSGMQYKEGSIISPDGLCRPFDANAKGTVKGNGAGIVVLKRYADAVQDGDSIYAVICGSAVNNDGAIKIGYTASSIEGQAEVISEAMNRSEISADQMRYVEAHGTGTILGDPIEIKALSEVYRESVDSTGLDTSEKNGYCAIGSVKANIGHLDIAAGVAGLIKTTQALHHNTVPPAIHYDAPNPKIDFDNSPFYVPVAAAPFHSDAFSNELVSKEPVSSKDQDIYAGVSSFGIGGTNAHVVLKQINQDATPAASREPQLLVMSAKSAVSLEKQFDALAGHFATHFNENAELNSSSNLASNLAPNLAPNLADAAYTLQIGRGEFEHRACIVGEQGSALAEQLQERARTLHTASDPVSQAHVYFLFPGQGAQHPGMLRDLYQSEPVFAEAFDACVNQFDQHLSLSLKQAIWPDEELQGEDKSQSENQSDSAFTSTLTAQPAIFATEYALAQQWLSVGITPHAMLGHSIGEYVAACIAGVFSLEDAVRLVSTRAQLLQALPAGDMMMVQLSEQDIQPLLSPHCALAAVNGPNICVLAGETDALQALQTQLEAQGVSHRILHTSHAFHSHMLEPALHDFHQAVSAITLNPPTQAYLSNLTGDWIDADAVTTAQYWVDHMRQTVRFADAMAHINADPNAVLLEVGPGQVLSTLAKRSFNAKHVVSSARHAKDQRNDVVAWLQAVGQLWCAGVTIDWLALHGINDVSENDSETSTMQRRRIAMPTYQFDRQRHWISPSALNNNALNTNAQNNEQPADASPANSKAHESESSTPRSAAELVRETWRMAFGLSAIKNSDNFFELGGDSLLATQLISVLRNRLKVKVALSELFSTQTFGEFLALIQERVEDESQLFSANQDIASVEPDFSNRFEPFDLTDIQQAYWVGRTGAVELGDVATHIYLEVDIKDGDASQFESGWNQLIQHHDMLRAIFLASGKQQILESVPYYDFEVIDLSGRNAEEVTATQLQVRDQMSHQIIPADTWPLFDIKTIQSSARKFRLCISIDILIVDAWSMNMLIEQWLKLYRDSTFALPPLAFSFRDYVIAEHALRETELYQQAENYWFDRIDTLPAAPALPLAISPNTLKDVKFERRVYEMPKDRWDVLKRKAVENSLTPTGLLITAFSEVLALWCQAPSFTLNLTNYSRHPFHPDAEYIVGDFTSLTLLQVDMQAERSFLDNAKALQQQLWHDLDNRFVSAVHLLREMGKRANRRVAMPVVFTSTLGGRALSHEDDADELGEEVFGVSQTSQVWFDHQVMEWQGKLKFNWDVVSALFPPNMIQSMFDVYTSYLNRLVDDESAWGVNPMDHLLPADHLAIIQQANRTEQDLGVQPLGESFVKAARRYPEHTALVTADRSLSYQELWDQAQAIAQQLANLGINRNDIVGIYIDKSWQQIATALGILLSGAGYLPMDVKLPSDRLRFIAQNSGMKALITSDAYQEGSSQIIQDEKRQTLPVLVVENIEPVNAKTVYFASAVRNQLDDLAYVLYTSGSTGQPKGVMLPHRGPANTVANINRTIGMSPEDRVIGLSALHFDLSVYDVFGALSSGAALVLVEPQHALEPQAWQKLFEQHQISVWNSVPALMQMYTDYRQNQPDHNRPLEFGEEEMHDSLRTVILSGDWIPPQLPLAIASVFTHAKVLGAGGPTECSIWSANHWVAFEDDEKESIPYGYPMANQRIYVLNSQLKQCPVGVAGEMYIAGDGLALGYLNDSEKTDSVFIHHPETGERLYKSGDLGRYTHNQEDGLEILGRSDFQVKINGYRIELGEVEAAIKASGQCKDVVVVASGAEGTNTSSVKGKTRLVAFVVNNGADEQAQEEQSQESTTVLNQAPNHGVPNNMANSPELQAKLLEFKLSKPGLRRNQAGDETVVLPAETQHPEHYKIRKSYREYLGEPLTLEKLSATLSALSAYRDNTLPMPKFRYASAGSLHPVQLYVYIKPGQIAVSANDSSQEQSNELAGGFYYYQPDQHQLVRLAQQSDLTRASWGVGENPNIYDRAAFALFMVGESNAIDPVYGQEDARGMMYLEAGYMAQLLMETAPQGLVGLCPIGYVNPDVNQKLGLSDSQSLLHAMVGGAITSEQVNAWSADAKQSGGQKSEASDSVALIRAHLAGKLPDYMIPSAFVRLDAIPLTANGKVNRKALVNYQVEAQEIVPKVDPRNAVEQSLLEIWQQLLGETQVGVEDNFFESGGDSVLIVQVHQQLQAKFNSSLTVVDLFKYPTIAQLAEAISDSADSAESANTASGDASSNTSNTSQEKAQQRKASASKQKAALSKRRKQKREKV